LVKPGKGKGNFGTKKLKLIYHYNLMYINKLQNFLFIGFFGGQIMKKEGRDDFRKRFTCNK